MMLSSKQVATALGLSVVQVINVARRMGLGTRVGSIWVFSQKDVNAMRRRRGPGRPAGGK